MKTDLKLRGRRNLLIRNGVEMVEPGGAHDREGDLSYAKSLY